MHILLPAPLDDLPRQAPVRPRPPDVSRTLKVALTVFLVGLMLQLLVPALGRIMLFRLIVGGPLLTAGLGGVLVWLAGPRERAKHAQALMVYERQLARFVTDKTGWWKRSLQGLPRQDFRGAHNARTPVGKNEHRLAASLRAVGLAVVKEARPADASIVEQYELKELGWRQRNYVADFAYLDPISNVRIDIEIDEAYHQGAVKRQKDRDRDQTFLGRGWTVVRIPEAELLRSPAACAERLRMLAEAMTRADVARIVDICRATWQ